jgi:hypothetical protein
MRTTVLLALFTITMTVLAIGYCIETSDHPIDDAHEGE